MNNPKFGGKMNQTRVAMIAIISLIAILLVLAAVFLILIQKNKNNDVKATPTPAESVSPTPTQMLKAQDTPTPSPTQSLKWEPTNTPIPTVKVEVPATATPVPTQAVETFAIPGVQNANIIKACTIIRDELLKNASEWTNSTTGIKVEAKAYVNTGYTSVVFTCTAGGMQQAHLDPHVFLNATGTEVLGSDAFNEAYFPIIKERLQEYAVKADQAFKGSDFVKASCAYEADDYDRFYIHDNKVTFVFAADTLGTVKHKEFTYDVDLSEAELFLEIGTDGKDNGYQIRTGLNPHDKMIAITFDDGPYLPVESKLLETFKKYDACCTFFSIGERIDDSKNCAKSIIELAKAGNEIASTTYSGKSYKTEDTDLTAFWQDVNKENLLLAKTLGYATDLFRMPGGRDKLSFMSSLPMPMINWSVDPSDWKNGIIHEGKVSDEQWDAAVDEVVDFVTKNAADGKIVILHSLYLTSADAVEEIMANLSKKGYRFVTVSELCYYKGIELQNGTVTYSTTQSNKSFAEKAAH